MKTRVPGASIIIAALVLLFVACSSSRVEIEQACPTATPLPTGIIAFSVSISTNTPSPTPTPRITTVPSATRLQPATSTAILDSPIPTPTKISTPTAWPTMTLTQPPVVCPCSRNTLNCPNFGTQVEAQACYDYCKQMSGKDIHELDGNDKDGKVCEGRP